MDRVALALGLEELPDRAHLHELRGFLLQLLDAVEKLDGLLVVLRQAPLEIPFETEMAAVEHGRIDVAPDLGQIRDGADLAIEIRRRRNRYVAADAAAAGFRNGHGRLALRGRSGPLLAGSVRAQNR